MFLNFLLFELKYRLRQPMPYLFFLIIGLMIYAAVSSDKVTVGGDMGNVHVNSPYSILFYSAIISLVGMLMITAFINTAALRDYQHKFNEILFSTPIKKSAYLGGRFLGSVLVAIVPFFGVFAGVFVGSLMPWLEATKVGPFVFEAYWKGVLLFIVPNTLFIGAITFSIAVWTRSTIAAFVGTLGILVGYSLAQSFVADLDNEMLSAMTDPFGVEAFSQTTKYWTPDERNSLTPSLSGYLLYNRLLWLGVGALIWFLGYWRFSFAQGSARPSAKSKANVAEAELKTFFSVAKPLPAVTLQQGWATQFGQYFNQVKIDLLGIVRSTPFIVMLCFALLNMWGALSSANEGYGLTRHPVTYNIVDMLRGSMYIFVIAILTFFSGELIWKERDAKMDEFFDALPYPNWVLYMAKFKALGIVIVLFLLLGMAAGLLAQTYFGYTNYELPVYARLLGYDFINFVLLAALALFLQVLINNRYVAYFVFIAFLIANNFIWSALDVESKMVMYANTGRIIYSDMNRYGAFALTKHWFIGYWGLFAALLSVGALLFWVRGKSIALGERVRIARERWTGSSAMPWAGVGLLVLWVLLGGFAFYNTKVLNTYQTTKQAENLQEQYERAYKKYQHVPQPRITAVVYDLDLYPQQRDLYAKAQMTIENKTALAIDSLHFTLPTDFKVKITLPNATLALNDTLLGYQIYVLQKPLQTGDSLVVHIQSEYVTKGFENSVKILQIAENGSFFNNGAFMPDIGYQEGVELSDKYERKKRGLPYRPRMNKLQNPCGDACNNTYLSNSSDWVRVEATFSTDADQIAIAPGTLVSDKTNGNRRTFHYRLEDPVLNFYSFISARYEVKREKWNDVDIEVYYHKDHKYNVDKMAASMKDALTYYSANFGPYPRRQARIIEFPRYASFAQAFPGTMPYSEGIGFIASIEDEDDIDMVYYVVAHEMAHQWWAHQVIGASVQGCTMLSETFAQYSALMVMEKKYGRDQMEKFLYYELDDYLQGRAAETEKELPLMYNEGQPYIHYRKGSLVMYALRTYIGEQNLNAALKAYRDSVAYQQPPYTTTPDVMRNLYAATPDSLHYLLKDMFEDIVLYSNKTLSATARKLPDGKYEVTLKTQTDKFRADTLGREERLPNLADWVEIGVFGKAEKGKKHGKLLLTRYEKITQSDNEFVLITDEEPEKAGIDLNYLLIDRVPDDNCKKVTL